MAAFLSCRITHLCVIFEQEKERNWKETVLLNVAECGRRYCVIVNTVDIGSIDWSRYSVASLVSISSSDLSQDTSLRCCTRTLDTDEFNEFPGFFFSRMLSLEHVFLKREVRNVIPSLFPLRSSNQTLER